MGANNHVSGHFIPLNKTRGRLLSGIENPTPHGVLIDRELQNVEEQGTNEAMRSNCNTK